MNRLALIFVSSLMLASCGGGGGGGGGGDGTPASDANAGTTNIGSSNVNDNASDSGEEPSEFEQDQNEYLPLVAGKGWVYDLETLNEDGSTSVRVSANEKPDRYDLDYGVITQTLTSTPTEVSLYSIIGDIQVSNFISVTGLDFGTTPITLLDLEAPLNQERIIDQTASVTTAFLGVPSTYNFNVYGAITYEEVAYQSDDFYNGATYPSLKASATYTLSNQDLAMAIDITDTINYVKGIGIVSRAMTVKYINSVLEDISMDITNMLDLPVPITFSLAQGIPVQDGDASIRMSDTLSPSSYTILNGEAIDALDWLSVDENAAQTAYEVSMSVGAGLPSETTSTVVYLGTNTPGEQLPVNITLVVPTE